jgi:hypothetical protein
MVIGLLYLLVLVISLLTFTKGKEPKDIQILGIEPNSGPISGETRVLVRLKDFDVDLIDDYPHPNVN